MSLSNIVAMVSRSSSSGRRRSFSRPGSAAFRFGVPLLVASMLFAAGLMPLAAVGADAPLVFSATGDGPRGEEDWDLLPAYFRLEKEDGETAFMVHVGDICPGRKTLPEAYYQRVAALLKTCPIPLFIVPGDNEWNDLNDPPQAWKYWSRNFLGFEQNFPGAPKVRRQQERPENMAWTMHGVLLIGINLVGGRIHDAAEWKTRMRQDADWVRENFTREADHVRAAVVFCQAAPGPNQQPFVTAFVQAAKDFGKPVLFIHGDGHVWVHVAPWLAPNLQRIQVDKVAKGPPVKITVTTDPTHPFLFDRRLKPKDDTSKTKPQP